MTITTYTDREIALQAKLAAALQLAKLNGEIAAELKADKMALEAAIDSSRKQEAVAFMTVDGRVSIKKTVETTMPNVVKSSFNIPLYAAPVVAPDVPDMFWNADDSEKMHTSISEFLNDEICNGTELEVGAIFTIQQAKRLQDIRIKVTSIDDNEFEADYEVIDAAMEAQMTDTVKMPEPGYFTTKNGRLWTFPDEVDQTGLELRIYTEAQMKQYGDDRARWAQQAEQGWQTIESAPKSNPMNPEHRLIFWLDGVGPAFGYAYDDGDGGLLTVINGYYGGRWEPTHWQVIPAVPKGGV